MSPKRRQDRNAFLVFLAIVPFVLLLAPLPYLRAASENYAANKRIEQQELAAQRRATEARTAAGASAAPASGSEAAER